MMRTVLLYLLYANLALVVWTELLLGGWLRHRLRVVEPASRRLAGPLGLGNDAPVGAAVARGEVAPGLAAVWRGSLVVRRVAAVAFLVLFIYVIASARAPHFAALVRHFLPFVP